MALDGLIAGAAGETFGLDAQKIANGLFGAGGRIADGLIRT
jgi:hypothetical protein